MTIFSPKLTPTIYDRGEEQFGSEINKREYDDWTLVVSAVRDADNVAEFGDGMVMFHDEVGTAYIGDGHAHVADSMYRSHPVIFLQEFLASALMYCKREDVVKGVECTKEQCVYREK